MTPLWWDRRKSRLSRVDGQAFRIGKLDLYDPKVFVTLEMDPGNLNLRAGGNVLEVEIEGSHSTAQQAFVFGFDYQRLKSSGNR